MIKITIFFILSFFLESIIPSILKDFLPLFVISIILFLDVGNKKHYILLLVISLIYDFLFTSSLFLNTFIFFIIYYIKNIISIRKINFIKYFLLYNLSIIIYITFMILMTFLYKSYDYYLFIKVLKSLPINYIYFVLVYIIFKFKSNSYQNHSY